MMKLDFYIQKEQIYDTKGSLVVEDENGIVKVNIDGEERRFIRAKLVRWLEVNPEIRQAKIPKPKRIPSQYEVMMQLSGPVKLNKPKKAKKEKLAKTPKETKPRVKKEKPVKLPRIPKEPKVKVKKQMGRKRIYPRDENGRRIDKLPKGYINHTHGGEYGFPRRAVLCTTNGKEYNSLYQAAKELGVTRASIHHVISGKYKTTKGYQFQYSEPQHEPRN